MKSIYMLWWTLFVEEILLAMAFRCAKDTTAMQLLAGRDLSGQVHVITGGDTGIGHGIAMALAASKAAVILGCRGTDGKYARAVENITRATGNPHVSIMKLDLSSFASVKSFVLELKERAPVIDAIHCNAGIAENPTSLPPLTNDGFERVFEVNFLSHFLLVEKLLPVLRRSKGRIIHVSSSASFKACRLSGQRQECMDLGNLPPEIPRKGDSGNGLFNFTNYGVSKYMQVFHAAELTRRETNVKAYSVHPGLVQTPMASRLCRSRVRCLSKEEGAATSVYVATASAEALQDFNGNYFNQCRPVPSVRSEMVSKIGEAATLSYQQDFYELCLEWTKPSVL